MIPLTHMSHYRFSSQLSFYLLTAGLLFAGSPAAPNPASNPEAERMLPASASRAGEPDPRGPIEYPGMKAVADKTGVHAPGYSFVNNCKKPDPWQAKWIWMPNEDGSKTAMFRKEITLDELPAQVSAWMTADAKYRLYINGRLVSRGPVDIGYDYTEAAAKRDINEVSTKRWFYDSRDLRRFSPRPQCHHGGSVWKVGWPILACLWPMAHRPLARETRISFRSPDHHGEPQGDHREIRLKLESRPGRPIPGFHDL